MPRNTTTTNIARRRLRTAIYWTMMVASILAVATRKTAAFCSRSLVARQGNNASRLFASVTGSVYESESSKVVVTLYTKEGCTLCDKVKDVLQQVQQGDDSDFVHSLRQIDITDSDQQDSFDRYKYDIPVLHIGYDNNDGSESVYWTKHRLTEKEAKEGIAEAMSGSFEPRKGRPNASAMER